MGYSVASTALKLCIAILTMACVRPSAIGIFDAFPFFYILTFNPRVIEKTQSITRKFRSIDAQWGIKIGPSTSMLVLRLLSGYQHACWFGLTDRAGH